MPEAIYDGKELFETYCGWGAASSTTRLVLYAKEKYGQTSQMGPYYAMWKWAFQNPKEAYPLWKEYCFERYPEKEQPTFEDFVKDLASRGRNQNIGGNTANLQKFCARYGIPMEFSVEPEDVIQVTRPNHVFFQRLFVVSKKLEDAEPQAVEAFAINPDGTITNHQFRMNEFGIIGRVIL